MLILSLIFIISCSSPSNPDNGNEGNNGGSTVPPPTGPTEEELIAKYGIDIGQDDATISQQIEGNLKAYYAEMGSYRVIFTGTPKDYTQDGVDSLASLIYDAAIKINVSSVDVDLKNIDFKNGAIESSMFAEGYSSQEAFTLNFIFPENKITTIKSSAFRTLSSLKQIAIPDSVISIEYRAFQSIYSLKTLVLGNKLQTIGDYAFVYLQSLRELIIPDSVISIGEGAFANSHLEKLTISASVKEIKSSAFNTSRNLKTLIYLGTSPNDINYQSDSFLYCDNLTILILPNVPNPDYNTWKNFLGRNFTEVKQQE